VPPPEVLQFDRVALRDKEPVNRQQRLEEQLRAKTAARREGGKAVPHGEHAAKH
jgi:hypothetical protein